METQLTHRDATVGLFIGASMLLFALMNSAPAELLHLLVYAALQPIGYAIWQLKLPALAKKNAGNNAGVGILCETKQTIFRRNSRLARETRGQRRKQIRSIRSSTV